MEKKYYISDIKKMGNYDFSTRLKFFIEKWGKKESDFYEKLYERLGISERAFKSYLASKENISARKPKKETINVMAEILNIPPLFLVWDAEEFESIFNNYLDEYQKNFKVQISSVDIETDYDVDPWCYNTKEENFEIFKEKITNEYPKDEEHKEIYCFLEILVSYWMKRKKKFVINEKVYTIINCFECLNQMGREKLLKYGNIIIDDVLSQVHEKVMFPLSRKELIKNADFNFGKFKLGYLDSYPYLDGMGEELLDLNLQEYQWDIFLLCFNIDTNNNSFFPDDALESFVLIAQLFSLDEEFVE